MNKQIRHLAQSGTQIEAEVNFVSTKDLTSLSEFHHKGNRLRCGQGLWLERNARTEHIKATLIAWSIGSVKYDLTGYGKYADSYIIVELEGDDSPVSWPFSMAYIREE